MFDINMLSKVCVTLNTNNALIINVKAMFKNLDVMLIAFEQSEKTYC